MSTINIDDISASIAANQAKIDALMAARTAVVATPSPAAPIYVRPAAPAAAPRSSVTVTNRTAPGRKTNLTEAHYQWANRPSDERFWTLQEMAKRIGGWKNKSEERVVDTKQFEVITENGDLLLMGGGLEKSKFTNWSFSQLCTSIKTPSAFVSTLPAKLATDVINHGLEHRRKTKKDDDDNNNGMVLIRNPGNELQKIAALTSTGYSRIWNADVVERLTVLEQQGWRVPPARPTSINDPRSRPATEADILHHNKNMGGAGIHVGDMIAPAGLYASDRDMFVFMVTENVIDPGDGGEGINRGFFVKNSEVGDCSFDVTTFGYDGVCGNHIVWGATNVIEVSLVHRGKANERWIEDMSKSLREYANQSGEVERRNIQAAMQFLLGGSKKEVIDTVFNKKSLGITKMQAEEAYDLAMMESDLRKNRFAPQSVWGMVCGLTRLSQQMGFANKRTDLDAAAGKLMLMVN